MAVHAPTTGAPTRAPGLSAFARACLAHCSDPDTMEDIGRVFLNAAAELRAVMQREAGNA